MSRRQGTGRAADVVLITIDCWRHDALSRMEWLSNELAAFDRSEAICHAPATDGAFPALLASTYYPSAYCQNGMVGDDVVPLSSVLAESGYETAGFIGSNPFLGKWSPHFDAFWNDGMVAVDASSNRSKYTLAHTAWNLLRMRPRVTADEVATRARDWFEDASPPRFLWLHLMDLHGPYLPGFARGASFGTFNVYQSLIRFSRHEMDVSESVLDTVRSLYWACVETLDERLSAVLEFLPDDAVVVITADHGEELNHGYIGHARLYDECVRVPLLIKHPRQDIDGEFVRQIDLAPTILDWLDIDAPSRWEGQAHERSTRPASLLNHAYFGETDAPNRIYAGVRTREGKLIHTYDSQGEQIGTEFYDLRTDSGERQPLTEHPKQPALQEELMAFLKREDIELGATSRRTGLNEQATERLRELGYL